MFSFSFNTYYASYFVLWTFLRLNDFQAERQSKNIAQEFTEKMLYFTRWAEIFLADLFQVLKTKVKNNLNALNSEY